MLAQRRIKDLIEAGWCIVDAPDNDHRFAQWKQQALDCLIQLVGPDHAYISYLRESFGRAGKLSVLSGTGILDAAREQLTGSVSRPSDLVETQRTGTIRRIIMRIDYGPNFDEIRDSVENGTWVTFGSTCGEELRCVILEAKLDAESGRAALTVEEQATAQVYFVRYSHRGERRSCGDFVTWRLSRNEIEELRRVS